MRPCFSTDYPNDCIGRDVEAFGQSSQWSSSRTFLSDVVNVRCGELGVPMAFPSRHSTFPSSIRHVLFVGTKKQMVWVAATAVVTLMQYVLPWWDRAVLLLVHVSVYTSRATTASKQSITVRADKPLPFPTTASCDLDHLLNIGLGRFRLGEVPALLRAVQSSTRRAFQPRWVSDKRCSTTFTRFGHSAV